MFPKLNYTCACLWCTSLSTPNCTISCYPGLSICCRCLFSTLVTGTKLRGLEVAGLVVLVTRELLLLVVLFCFFFFWFLVCFSLPSRCNLQTDRRFATNSEHVLVARCGVVGGILPGQTDSPCAALRDGSCSMFWGTAAANLSFMGGIPRHGTAC